MAILGVEGVGKGDDTLLDFLELIMYNCSGIRPSR